jgi:protein-disulfide isomerase
MATERKRSARKGGQGETERIPWGVVSAVVLALLAMGLAVSAIVFHFADEDEEGGAVVQPTPTPAAAVVSADDDPFIGPKDAEVTIIEFNDFQ